MTFNLKKYAIHRVTVDALLIKQGQVLLLKRSFPPFQGSYVLPGGHVEYGEDLKKAALRELKEETGLTGQVVKLLDAYYVKDRALDPRGPHINVIFLIKPIKGKITNSRESTEIKWWPLKKLPTKMGFDHKEIIKRYLQNQ